jgi:hypothetical protein
MTRSIRPSSLTTYADCSRRWAARHLADDVAAAGYTLRPGRALHIGAAVGGAVHAAAGYTMSSKRATGDLGNETEAIGRAEAEFEDRAQYGVTWDHTTSDLSTAMKQIARMSKVYRRQVAPELAPLVVEERFEADIGDDWQISGQIDTLAGDPDAIIEDLKTGTVQRANGVQYATYAMLFRAHGYRVTGIYEDFIRRVPIAHSQPPAEQHQVDLEPAIADAWELIEAVKRDTAEFLSRVDDPHGKPPPNAFRANPASMLCGEKFCPAHSTDFCKAHRVAR